MKLILRRSGVIRFKIQIDVDRKFLRIPRRVFCNLNYINSFSLNRSIHLNLYLKRIKSKGNKQMTTVTESIFSQYKHVNVNISIGDLLEIDALNNRKNVLSFNKSALHGLKDNFDYKEFFANLQKSLEESITDKESIISNNDEFEIVINRVQEKNSVELYVYIFFIKDNVIPVNPFAIINMTVGEDKVNLRLITSEFHDVLESYCDSKLKDLYKRVSTYYMSGNDLALDTNLINVQTCDLPDQSFYPWIQTDLRKYMQDFLDSKQTILLLMGPPGTGKTTFIRQLMVMSKSDSYQAFDRSAIENPELIIKFNNSDGNVLAIEDADAMIGSRESGNTILAGYLNFADGVTKKENKKLIISTNLSNTTKIDEALIRPGRCYDILNFRELTNDEANAARAAIGLEPKEFTEDVVLAKALSDSNRNNTKTKVGFI